MNDSGLNSTAPNANASSLAHDKHSPKANQPPEFDTQWLHRPLPVESFCLNQPFIKLTDDPSHPMYLPDRPLPGSAQEADEIREIVALQEQRDSGAIGCQQANAERRDLSPLLNLLGQVRTGRELGLRFADETPEVVYRVILNQALSTSGWSLEAKAQMRMVADATLYNARLIAWHYKWRSSRGISVTYRPRPEEVAPEIRVLYHADSPSYPSAHSTIAGAASQLLKQCFPQFQSQPHLDDLADNVGMSCLWAGVNYRSDHLNGLRLGHAVADLLLQQMQFPSV
jgi:hypothetical protein